MLHLSTNTPLSPAVVPRRPRLRRFEIRAGADFGESETRQAEVFKRIARREPTIDQLLLIPTARMPKPGAGELGESHLPLLCSQNHALRELLNLRATHIFPEARLYPFSVLSEETRNQVVADFEGFPKDPMTPAQIRHLILHGAADIYAAVSGARIRSSIGEKRLREYLRAASPELIKPGGKLISLFTPRSQSRKIFYDRCAEDMARRVENFLGAEDTENARVAVVSPYPFGLAGHLNSYVKIRSHDCTRRYLPEGESDSLERERRHIMSDILERRMNGSKTT